MMLFVTWSGLQCRKGHVVAAAVEHRELKVELRFSSPRAHVSFIHSVREIHVYPRNFGGQDGRAGPAAEVY